MKITLKALHEVDDRICCICLQHLLNFCIDFHIIVEALFFCFLLVYWNSLICVAVTFETLSFYLWRQEDASLTRISIQLFSLFSIWIFFKFFCILISTFYIYVLHYNCLTSCAVAHAFSNKLYFSSKFINVNVFLIFYCDPLIRGGSTQVQLLFFYKMKYLKSNLK